MQYNVGTISFWIHSSGISIIPTKSTLLVTSRKRAKPCISLQINSISIPCAESTKYLGVTISSDLKWNLHVSNTCKSATSTRRILPKPDYCSCVWDPHTDSLIDRLQSVQSFATKLCSERWSASSAEVSLLMNLPPLRSCRIRQKAQLSRRIIRHESILPFSSYFNPLPPFQSLYSPFTFSHCTICRTTSFQHSFFVSACTLEQPS